MKYELQNIISGEGKVRHGRAIQAVASYLKRSQTAGEMAQEFKHFRAEENKKLEIYIELNNLWVLEINLENYVSEGAEQKVFIKDGKNVLKLNDAVFYNSWIDYFHNLLLYNFFFPDTAYKLLGFYKDDNIIFAVVEKPFVKTFELTDLQKVKNFMTENGFENNRNNDYFNADLGIILEDLHDENVLTSKGNLYFIDTVFYLTNSFFNK